MASAYFHSPSTLFWLTTDLDGTLIPIAKDRDKHRAALRELGEVAQSRADRSIVFVTGRHLESVLAVMERESLPLPHSIITDVGSRIWNRVEDQWVSDADYDARLDSLTGGVSMQELAKGLGEIPGVALQSSEHQGLHKLSYECDAAHLEQSVEALEAELQHSKGSFSITASIDPFSNRGLVDILPSGVNKRFAIEWFQSEASGRADDALMFCGDSGNDLQVFLSPLDSVVVHNTPASVQQTVREHIAAGTTPERSVYFATHASTSGVLEGARHFGWLDPA